MAEINTMLNVVESRVSRMMIRCFAEEVLPDCTFVEAGDGDEALQLIADQEIDLMTIYLNMPGMDGLELIEQSRPRFPDARIALLTANIQDSVRQKAEAAGVGFMSKPVTVTKVRSYVAPVAS